MAPRPSIRRSPTAGGRRWRAVRERRRRAADWHHHRAAVPWPAGLIVVGVPVEVVPGKGAGAPQPEELRRPRRRLRVARADRADAPAAVAGADEAGEVVAGAVDLDEAG